MSVLLQPFTPININQTVPEIAKFKSRSAQSVIVDRQTISYPATSGPSYTITSGSGNANQISWLISDASKFLDLPSASLAFDYKATLATGITTETNTGSYCDTLPADNCISLFSRCQIKLSGINTEDIPSVSQFFNTKMASSMNKSYYEQNMNILAGSYVWNSDAYGGSSMFDDLNTRFKNAQLSDYNAVASTASSPATTSRSFVIPLSFISGLFSMQKLLPLPLLSTLEINLYLEPLAQSHYSITSTATANILPNLSVTLSNVRILADVCVMNAQYCQMLKEIALNDEAGISLAFDTVQSYGLSYNSSKTSPTSSTLTINKSSPFVRSIYASKSNPVNNNKLEAMNTCNFINNGNSGIRVHISSNYYPVHGDTQNNAITYAYMKSGEVNNALSGSLQNMATYSGAILPTVGTAVTAGSRDSLLANFTFGVQFDKSSGGELDLDGLDTSALGSALTINMNENYNSSTPSTVDGNMNLNVFLAYTKHLSLRGGNINISG